MSRLSRRRPALALAQPVSTVALQEDTRRVLERRDRDSGKLEARWQKDAADGAAATITTETLIWSNPPDGVLRRVATATFTPASTRDIDGTTNFARIRLMRRPADGSAVSHLATLSSALKSWRIWVPATFDFDGRPPLIEPGGSVTFAIDKPGTGSVVPKGTLLLTLVEA